MSAAPWKTTPRCRARSASTSREGRDASSASPQATEPGRGCEERRSDVEERRLARTRAPGHDDELAAMDERRHVVEDTQRCRRPVARVDHADRPQLEHRLAAHRAPLARRSTDGRATNPPHATTESARAAATAALAAGVASVTGPATVHASAAADQRRGQGDHDPLPAQQAAELSRQPPGGDERPQLLVTIGDRVSGARRARRRPTLRPRGPAGRAGRERAGHPPLRRAASARPAGPRWQRARGRGRSSPPRRRGRGL